MYRTTAYVGHFLARFERNVKLYMACAALIGFSAFGIYSVLFNLYLLRMNYDVGLIGHFNAAGLLSFGLFSPIAGNWARRAGYRRTLAGGMSLMVMGYLLAVPLSVFAGADKTAVATRTDTPPVIDGHLSDHCWDLAVPTTDFILLDPVEGDMAAFAELVTRYQNGVFLFFCRMTGRSADAEDLAQETFVRVYESLHSLDDPTRFRSWFWAIASNLCRDYHKYRLHRHHLSIERDINLDLQLADMGSARTVELASRIRTALATLDDEWRLVVVLREYHELSYEEIAATVGCSVGAVRWRLHAARQQLRASLSDLIG